ncbi:SDR family NAD(P)-dependent oxidoreductase [Pleionea sediminis]|uniref:SDR family NAD(P)-dependent oxidoreductase n=1 Tax=Pleionea sediminis TaxID=2569479 RepID=UPI0011861E2D|nr:SDR family oxidoreductase [Pleionea sediminis]
MTQSNNTIRSSKDKLAIIIGATSGTGLALTHRFAKAGMQVIGLGRNLEKLNSSSFPTSNTQFIECDGSRTESADHFLSKYKPDLIVITGGTHPKMSPINQMDWAEFSEPWNNDTKITFEWTKAVINHYRENKHLTPIKMISISSGAALHGSPLSGGYAGAKRMQTFITEYGQIEADAYDLPITFLSITPKQLIEGTDIALSASSVYAMRKGITQNEFMAQWKKPLTLELVAQQIESIVSNDKSGGCTYLLSGDGFERLS